MPADESNKHRFQMELTSEELALLDELVERSERRATKAAGAHAKVTRRSVIIEALGALQSRLDDLDRPRSGSGRQ